MAIDINDPRARQMLLAGMPQQPMMQQPMAPQMAQPQAQGPDSLAEFTRLLGGDLSASLTGGDKLLALSALMRSATRSGRRAGLTPQQVMGQLQQQKVAEMQNRLTIEQMRAKMAQEQQLRQAVEAHSQTLPEDQRMSFMALPSHIQTQILARDFVPPKFEKTEERNGVTYAIYDRGPPVKLDLPRNVKQRQVDDGRNIIIYDDNDPTGEPIRIIPKQQSLESIASTNRPYRVTTKEGVYLVAPNGKVVSRIGSPTSSNFLEALLGSGGSGDEIYPDNPGEN